ncbi:ABC transporter permease [Kiritimatiellaeota bacterium B1221]|nr:ABC transporter permease [Kiritimatiellaeota bacterium B1221]
MASINKFKYTVWNLILKDFRTQYRNMSLGVLWSVLNPLIMLGVLVIVFGYIHTNRAIEHFAVFLLLGLIPFNFFSLCINASTSSLVHNSQIIKKMSFPRIIIPVSTVLAQVIHLVIQLVLLVLFVVLSGVPVTLSYFWLPLILLVELIFILGLSLICSVLDVFFRDTQYIVQSILTVLFWFTPIFYPASLANENLSDFLYKAFMANPLSGCIEAARRAVLYQSPPEANLFIMACLVSILTLIIGIILFRKLEKNVADYL